ncbi:dNA topoisomerase [Clostridium sp. CAG:567]|nr:dNA topoisomerase [Clostridium sp. CAG:567]
MIGINFSRLLSIIYGKRMAKDIGEEKISISVGRVMTCVLGMIVQREREIRNFVKIPYYRIIGKFGDNDSSFDAEWKVTEKSKMWESPKLYNENGFKKENDGKDFILSLKDKKAIITEVKKTKTKENAPLLFNLAEIQNESTKRFKIKPDQTLEIIQNLYEKKLVTYPRTDARVLSTAVAKVISKNLNGIAKGLKDEEIQTYINKMINEKYSTDLIKTKYVNDSKITDHYAIIPTGQGFENYNSLPDLQKQMYKLIVKRFLSIFYPPAEYSKIAVTIEVENEQFSANGKVCENLGYLEVAKNEPKKESKNLEEQPEEQNNLEILKKLKKGEEIEVINYETKTSETSPPSRYNSGSMILAMENAGKLIEEEELREQIKGAGIGTSATRAEIMKKLERIGYIAINSKTQIITPTDKGEKIYDVVFMSMPDMLNPKLTASWEKGLEMVSSKQIKPDEFMTKLEAYINSKINKLVIKR